MKRFTIPLLTLALAAPLPALAKPNHSGPNPASGAHLSAPTAHCPPGLAKKSPACVPPGQVKAGHGSNTHGPLSVGDVLDGSGFNTRYILVRDPGGYGLDPYGTFYRVDGQVIQVDRETSEVIALLGAVSDILN